MPSPQKPEFGPGTSPELDIPTKIAIVVKKKDQENLGRLKCPSCWFLKPGNKIPGSTPLVAIPERLEHGAAYACTVCAEIIDLEHRATQTLVRPPGY